MSCANSAIVGTEFLTRSKFVQKYMGEARVPLSLGEQGHWTLPEGDESLGIKLCLILNSLIITIIYKHCNLYFTYELEDVAVFAKV